MKSPVNGVLKRTTTIILVNKQNPIRKNENFLIGNLLTKKYISKKERIVNKIPFSKVPQKKKRRKRMIAK